MVIDFHTHIFPDKIAEKAIKTLEENLLLASGNPDKAYLDGTLGDLISSMTRNDISYSVVMPIATSTKQAESINRFASEITGKNNIISFGSVHPLQEDWADYLKKIKDMGLLGIKLHPEYQGFYIDSPESIKVLTKAQELGLLVMLHTGEDRGIKPPVHCTPKMLKNALNYVSGENIIAAHMGGYNMWEDVYKYLCKTPIYFDTSFSVGIMDDDLAKAIITSHGEDKILFATDSPWQDQGDVVKALKNLSLGKETEDKIFHKNAQKLLNL